MADNQLNGKGNVVAFPATNLSPADFPLGSPKSRAVARYVVNSRQPKLTQHEEDCLWLYCGACCLHGQMTPDWRELEVTPAYKRGSELRVALYGPVIPFHENPHALRSNMASLYFEQLHGREPIEGDVLRRTDWENYHAQELLEIAHFIDAWHRQIPDLLCPLKIEGGRRVYQHEKVYRSELPRDYPGRESLPTMFTEWREAKEYTAEQWWEWLCYALNLERFQMENIHVVMFLSVIDGEHRCRPATGAEVGQDHGNAFFGLNMEQDLGTVQKGRIADLVLLDANPLDDIKNTQSIDAVVVNGRLLDRKALDALLEQVENAARKN
jgi:hypothetical protein